MPILVFREINLPSMARHIKVTLFQTKISSHYSSKVFTTFT